MQWGGVLAGCVLALAAHGIAVLLTGAGHGWITPFFASFFLWIALPLTLATVWSGDRRFRRSPWLLGLLALGVAADFGLWLKTVDEGTEYFRKMMEMAPVLVATWLLFWLGWQLYILVALVRCDPQQGRGDAQ